jgi:hypothetical protein
MVKILFPQPYRLHTYSRSARRTQAPYPDLEAKKRAIGPGWRTVLRAGILAIPETRMKAVIELELIGHDPVLDKMIAKVGIMADAAGFDKTLFTGGWKKTQPWVARIVGFDPKYHYRREFVRAQSRDYSRANSVGSRGVYAYYVLGDGIYEVNERMTWKRTDRYFAQVSNGTITRITQEEVDEWLNTTSASMS